MQCPSCRAVYSNGLSFCPRCKTPASKPSDESEARALVSPLEDKQTTDLEQKATGSEEKAAPQTPATSAGSTLIEFPGVSRRSRPAWHKELSERVREIQERRSREAEEEARRRVEQPAALETGATQLGLVPPPEVPEVNPIVAAALKRLERARQPPPPMPRPRASLRGGTAAAATARVAEAQYEADAKPIKAQAPAAAAVTLSPAPPPQANPETIAPPPQTSEPAREHALSIVPAQTAPKVAPPPAKPRSRMLSTIEAASEQPVVHEPNETQASVDAEVYDDRAPVTSRILGGLIDLLVVAFASSPFAAIIELTDADWTDWRVMASMGGIVLIVMFLYLTASTALAGRTWGMALLSLRAVDAETGLPPTTKQSVGRALLYIVSLITAGLGLLYALFDVEGRTAHDHLSGTAVVRD